MAVRRPLLAGGKTLQIKACALSNGFGIWASLRPCMRPIWRSTVNNSGSLAAAAIMKNGATDRIPALDWAQRHGLPSSNVKITQNSGRIHGAACNDQIKQECITVFHGR